MGEQILYVGGYRLPDKNAAAQRVVANAAALRSLGHEVYFIKQVASCKTEHWIQCQGFPCYECPRQGMVQTLTSIKTIKKIVLERDITSVIAYNFPAIALKKLIAFCRKRKVKCYADATEWYQPQGNPIYVAIKKLDTEWRMRRLHKKMDGIIAISDYLWNYYIQKVSTIKVPPLVDLQQEKWQAVRALPKKRCCEETTFIYCGSPSGQKECLDQVVNSVECLAKKLRVKLNVIGITQAEYEQVYHTQYHGCCTTFWGRLPHETSLLQIAQCDWSIMIRDNNKVVRSGFPTKLSESISCGTPVVFNDFSNVREYMTDQNGILCDAVTLLSKLEEATKTQLTPDFTQFDYHSFTDAFTIFFGDIIDTTE